MEWKEDPTSLLTFWPLIPEFSSLFLRFNFQIKFGAVYILGSRSFRKSSFNPG